MYRLGLLHRLSLLIPSDLLSRTRRLSRLIPSDQLGRLLRSTPLVRLFRLLRLIQSDLNLLLNLLHRSDPCLRLHPLIPSGLLLLLLLSPLLPLHRSGRRIPSFPLRRLLRLGRDYPFHRLFRSGREILFRPLNRLLRLGLPIRCFLLYPYFRSAQIARYFQSYRLGL